MRRMVTDQVLLLLVVIALVGASCTRRSSKEQDLQATVEALQTQIASQSIPTPTEPPRLTSVPTPPPLIPATLLPTDTSVPAPTSTPTRAPVLTLPVQAGTLVPQPGGSIFSHNSEQVVQLARWGKGTVNQVAFSPDGEWLAVASSLGIYLYDSQTMAEVRFIETDDWTHRVAFSPDGQMLAADSTDRAVQLWRVSDGTLLRVLYGVVP